MPDLADFLAARVGEDIFWADRFHRNDCQSVAIEAPCTCGQPSRLRAEATARRRRLVKWNETSNAGRAVLARLNAAEDECAIKRASHEYSEFLGAQGVMQDVLGLDAQVYVDHPDYEQAVSRGLSTLPPEQRYDA